MSNKRDKFVSIAEKRVTRAIKDIRLIGNLSNKNNYAFEAKDVTKIINALEQEVKTLKIKFSVGEIKGEHIFKL